MATKKGTFFFVDVCIQTLNGTIDHTVVFLNLPENPNLEHFRSLLLAGPLGKPEKDIFFPSWTKSVHILLVDPEREKKSLTWEEIEEKKLTIDTTEKLQEIISKQEESSGCACLILQQCRSKRYSRKAAEPNIFPSQIPTSPISSKSSSAPTSPASKTLQSNLQADSHRFISAPISSIPNDLYPPVPQETLYYEQPIVPVTIFAPPSIYPQCYTIPIGMAPQPIPRYNILPTPTYLPHFQPSYFGYGVL